MTTDPQRPPAPGPPAAAARRPAAAPSLAPRLAAWARDVDGLLRLHFVFFSGLLPLLGAASVRRDLSAAAIATVVGGGLCVHVFAYLLNDVVDLPIDRTQPRRRGHPLARGALSPRVVLGAALAAAPVAAAATVVGGGGVGALGALTVAFGGLAVYDVWGKRIAVPLATDAVQGLAWGSLAPYGALAVGGAPNGRTWLVAAHAALFILVINGTNGGLRDLANDAAAGARTTAIAFGARALPGGDVAVPARLRAFALGGTAAAVALVAAAVATNTFGYGPLARRTTLMAVTALGALAIGLGAAMLRGHGRCWRLALRLHLFALLALLPAAFAAHLAPPVRWTLVGLLALSVAALLTANRGALLPPADQPDEVRR